MGNRKKDYGDYFKVSLRFFEKVRDIWSELREKVLGSEQWSVELLDSLLRKLHTIKGTSGQAGFAQFQQQIHKLEDYFVSAKKTGKLPVTDAMYTLADLCDLTVKCWIFFPRTFGKIRSRSLSQFMELNHRIVQEKVVQAGRKIRALLHQLRVLKV